MQTTKSLLQPACLQIFKTFCWMAGAATLLTSCKQKVVTLPPPAMDYVAKVGDISIAPGEYSEALAKRSKSFGSDRVVADLRQQVLDELIREKVLLNKARVAGLDRDPELVRRWERMVVAKY